MTMRLCLALSGIALIATLAVGCGGIAPDYTIHVSNSTTLNVTVAVNGAIVGVVAPKIDGSFPPNGLPPLPWNVEARSASGRLLVALPVAVGSVTDSSGPNGESTYTAPGARIDLSCGRLDLYVGVSRTTRVADWQEPGSGRHREAISPSRPGSR
jgi:hypothetical protein